MRVVSETVRLVVGHHFQMGFINTYTPGIIRFKVSFLSLSTPQSHFSSFFFTARTLSVK